MSIEPRESTDDVIAQERDRKFKEWLQNKSVRDRAVEMLGNLDTSRSENDDELKEVAIALCAVDRILNNTNDTLKNINENNENQLIDNIGPKKTSTTTSNIQKPLRNYWMKWAMENHTCNNVILSDNDVKLLSAATAEYFDHTSDGETILPSLKYFFPAIPKKSTEKAKPLTSDQKTQNIFYLREMKKLWKFANNELNNRLIDYITIKEQQILKSTDNIHNINRIKLRNKLEIQGLNEMSLKQLSEWSEEDQDRINKRINDDLLDKVKIAKTSHEQWVKSKDRFVYYLFIYLFTFFYDFFIY